MRREGERGKGSAGVGGRGSRGKEETARTLSPLALNVLRVKIPVEPNTLGHR